MGELLLGRVRKVRKVYSLIYGRRAISEHECCGNYTRSRAQAVKTFRTFRTFRNTAGRTPHFLLRFHPNGRGQKARVALVDQARLADARKQLEEALGQLALFEIVTGVDSKPASASKAAANR